MKKIKLTVDEAEALLRRESPEWVEVGGRMVEPSHLPEVRNALLKLRGMLMERLQSDQRMLMEIKEKMERQRFGGGK